MLLCSAPRQSTSGGCDFWITTDRDYYPDGSEPVAATVSLYGVGAATLELFLDGQSIGSQPVTLSGFTTVQQSIS